MRGKEKAPGVSSEGSNKQQIKRSHYNRPGFGSRARYYAGGV